MTRPIVCVVTSGRGDEQAALDRIRTAAAAGVDLIQIREPRLDDRALLDLTRRACAAARGTPARILVNDRLDIAVAADAHGVHLRGNSVSAPRLRAAAGAAALVVGRSVHDVEEALAVERAGGCDYLMFGTVFPSASKPAGHRAAGVEALREICGRTTLPVVAIGGITCERIQEVRGAGAAGIAAISLFDDAASIPAVVDLVRRTFDTSSGGCLKYEPS